MGIRVFFEEGAYKVTEVSGRIAVFTALDGTLEIERARSSRRTPFGSQVPEIIWDPVTTPGSLQEGFYRLLYSASVDHDRLYFVYVDRHGNCFRFDGLEAIEAAFLQNQRGNKAWMSSVTRFEAKRRRPDQFTLRKVVPLTRFERLDRDVVEEPTPPKKAPTTEEIVATLASVAEKEAKIKETQNKLAEPIFDLDEFLKSL